MILLNDLVKPANRLIAGVLRSPLHLVASGGLMNLTWTGRQSGKRYTVPVGYQRHSDAIVVLLSKPNDKTWWKNFRQPWPAELFIKRAQVEATGLLVEPTADAFYDYIERTLKRLPWMGSQFGGIKYDKSTGLTLEQREVLAEHVAVVVFTEAA